ncbi:hypothetical protein [Candidatus Neptunichlamydia sp. REUL1]|uniref:hypothetical protein n=1 Tax=Candidatus Neptunichlamydia sp. REUL1 TaxID=3064277 RepID=UPI00292DDBDA|nr:hypothetical protein [Candidatus Neptunochlamydia sp. REUL1]
MEKVEKTLTYLEAFNGMREFLEMYYNNTKSDDVGDILSATQLSIWEEGGTADPASWGEWIKCVEKAKQNKDS